MWSNRFVKWSATLAAVVAICTTVWAAADYTEVRPVIKKEFLLAMQVQKTLSDNLLLLRFQFLMQKKEYGGLSLQEKLELCQLARQLNFAVEGCL